MGTKPNILAIKITSDGTISGTRIYDERGIPLPSVQKITFDADSSESLTNCILKVLNIPIEIDFSKAKIEIAGYGKDFKKIEEMTPKEIIEALKYEAGQRYLERLHYIKK